MRGWQGKNKKGGKIKEEGIRGRETVVLFSLVWHYLSLLINPLRPSAWRSEGNGGGRGRLHEGRHERVEGWLFVGEGITLVPQSGPCFTSTCGFLRILKEVLLQSKECFHRAAAIF